jgi:hypothetical protein
VAPVSRIKAIPFTVSVQSRPCPRPRRQIDEVVPHGREDARGMLQCGASQVQRRVNSWLGDLRLRCRLLRRLWNPADMVTQLLGVLLAMYGALD